MAILDRRNRIFWNWKAYDFVNSEEIIIAPPFISKVAASGTTKTW